MTVEVENLRKEAKKVQELQGELRDLNERYHASLELLGERTEQVEELKADIADVKEMYRNQIVELVGQK
ncbi:TATA element modulatory factor 1 TATA binding protein [Fennellomyces sp. T-0311]|nr:TATA element modulatory factor 1 TATA binding protein [Fennellomyces sp. T-0311]